MKRELEIIPLIGLGLSIGSVSSFLVSLIIYGETINTTLSAFLYLTSVYIGMILLAVIFNIITLVLSWEGEKKRTHLQKVSLIAGITLMIIGLYTVTANINWLIGGILGYTALMLLSLSKSRLESLASLGTFTLMLGFLILLLVPTISAAYSSQPSYELAHIIFIVIGILVSLFGLYLIFATKIHISRMIGAFIGISSSTFSLFIVPAHEYVEVKSNAIYGIYDLSLAYFSIFIFWMSVALFLYEIFNEYRIDKILAEGYNHLHSLNLESAEERFLKVLENYESNIEALTGLGTTYAIKGKYDEGIKYLKKALELRPSEINYTNLGNIYLETGKIEEAEKMYKEALNYNERYLPALINLARLYIVTGKLDEAEKYLKIAKEQDQNKRSIDVIEAMICEKKSETKKLNEIYEKLKRELGEDVISLEVMAGA